MYETEQSFNYAKTPIPSEKKKAKHIFSYKQEEVAVTHSGIPKSMLEIFSVFFFNFLSLS